MPHSSGLPSPAADHDSWVQSSDLSLNSGTQPVAELPEDSIIGIHSKCPHFRILVIGRANVGKTTLLKQVCNSVKEPKIYDKDGKKIKAKILKESMKMIFKSNPASSFTTPRLRERCTRGDREGEELHQDSGSQLQSAEQLHAIWYCLPMADTTRPFLKTDEEFFDLEGVGNGEFTILALSLTNASFQSLLSPFSQSATDFSRKFVAPTWPGYGPQ
ncbi:hypothetical protein B0H13DRAFT_2134059 [Mycena leptocephala]|nr:hypothetical protein B0H13DRAFT_2134059 [Mycena leptocephala]